MSDMRTITCPVCEAEAATPDGARDSALDVMCERCGPPYRITADAVDGLMTLAPRQRITVLDEVRERTGDQEVPMITAADTADH